MVRKLDDLEPDPVELFYRAVMNSDILGPNDLTVKIVEADGTVIRRKAIWKSEIEAIINQKTAEEIMRCISRTPAAWDLNGADRYDIVQLSFVEIFGTIERFDPAKAKLSTWIRECPVRAATTKYLRGRDPGRRAAAQRGKDGDNGKVEPLLSLSTIDDPAAVPTEQNDPMLHLQRAYLRTAIAVAVQRLPPVYREVIRLRYELKMEFLEIAAALKINEANARKRVSRAMERLRNDLGEYLT